MAAQGWRGAVLRKGWKTPGTVREAQAVPAPDLVNREFTAAAPNRLWVADCTRVPTGEGVLWSRDVLRLANLSERAFGGLRHKAPLAQGVQSFSSATGSVTHGRGAGAA